MITNNNTRVIQSKNIGTAIWPVATSITKFIQNKTQVNIKLRFAHK